MAVNDIINAGQGQYDLTEGQYSPAQAARAYQASQDAENVQGLAMTPVVGGTDLHYKAKLAKAQQQFQNGGLSFQPPSNGQMLLDMLGGLLVGYASARLLGGDGKLGLSVGLLAAGGNHDADRAEVQRYGIIKDMLAKGGDYSEDALFNYMKTGDDKELSKERDEINKMKDAAQQHEWNKEDASQAEQWKQQDASQAHQWDMEKTNMVQAREDARAAASRANSLAVARINHPELAAAGGAGGFHLADGTPVQVVGKPIKQGSNVLLHVKKPDGTEELVNSDALQTNATPTQTLMNQTVNANINDILNADNSDLYAIANPSSVLSGGNNNMPWTANLGTAGQEKPRAHYNALSQVMGNRLLTNVAAAKAAGASGINTAQEVKMYNDNLPPIDTSSPEALKESLKKYRDYVNGGYKQYVNSGSGSSDSGSKSDSGNVSFNDLK